METQVINATEYRNLPLALLTESTTNPRKIFDEASLKELAESIRAHLLPGNSQSVGFLLSPRQ